MIPDEILYILRNHVLPAEAASRQAKNATTTEIIYRLSTVNLSPPLTYYEKQAYWCEASRRVEEIDSVYRSVVEEDPY